MIWRVWCVCTCIIYVGWLEIDLILWWVTAICVDFYYFFSFFFLFFFYAICIQFWCIIHEEYNYMLIILAQICAVYRKCVAKQHILKFCHDLCWLLFTGSLASLLLSHSICPMCGDRLHSSMQPPVLVVILPFLVGSQMTAI